MRNQGLKGQFYMAPTVTQCCIDHYFEKNWPQEVAVLYYLAAARAAREERNNRKVRPKFSDFISRPSCFYSPPWRLELSNSTLKQPLTKLATFSGLWENVNIRILQQQSDVKAHPLLLFLTSFRV